MEALALVRARVNLKSEAWDFAFLAVDSMGLLRFLCPKNHLGLTSFLF